MTRTEYQRILKENHFCANCKQQDAYTLNGRRRCAECAEKQRESKKRTSENPERRKELNERALRLRDQRKEKGLCLRCEKKAENGVYCNLHRLENNRRAEKFRREKGVTPRLYGVICWQCNENPVMDGGTLCEKCRERSQEAIAYARTFVDQDNAPWRKWMSDFWAQKRNFWYKKTISDCCNAAPVEMWDVDTQIYLSKTEEGISFMAMIKNKERAAKFGEVFTPEWVVKDMCDLFPDEIWNNIESTFLEPSCGTGNFLVEIYARKLSRCATVTDAVKALASITGVDILPDNCEESRERLKRMFIERFPDSDQLSAVDEILAKNIICDDFLTLAPVRWMDEDQRREYLKKTPKRLREKILKRLENDIQ